MSHGTVLQTGTPELLHLAPDSAAVARALGDANIFEAAVDADRAKTVLGYLPVQAPVLDSETVTAVLISPHQILVRAQPTADTAPAQVRRCTFHGADHRLELDVAGCGQSVIAYAIPAFAPGATVHLSVCGHVYPLQSLIDADALHARGPGEET